MCTSKPVQVYSTCYFYRSKNICIFLQYNNALIRFMPAGVFAAFIYLFHGSIIYSFVYRQ